MSLLAAVAAALACWSLLGPPTPSRLRPPPPGRSARPGGVVGRRAVLPASVGAATVLGGVLGGSTGLVLGFALALPAVTAVLVWLRHRRRAHAERNARAVAAACQLLVGLLRVGHVPSAALTIAARDAPVLAEAAALLGIGSEAAPALHRLGTGPGMSGLAELGAAWQVAERTGASLTATLDALADRLTARRAVEQVVAAELAAPRATGRLLAVLPVAGLVLGYALGGDPLAFLTGSLAGRLSLAAGVTLGCAGVLWTERIADREGG